MSSRAVSICCIGDSLTEGWTSQMPFDLKPYAEPLEWALEEEHGIVAEWAMAAKGGARTTAIVRYMESAIEARRLRLQEAGREYAPFDYCVILCGTNDISMGSSALINVLGNTIRMAKLALSEGSVPVLVTIPPLGQRFRENAAAYHLCTRYLHNQLLAAIAAHSNGRILFSDMHGVIGTKLDATPEEVERYRAEVAKYNDDMLEAYEMEVLALTQPNDDEGIPASACEALGLDGGDGLAAAQEALLAELRGLFDAGQAAPTLQKIFSFMQSDFDGDSLHLNATGYAAFAAQLAVVIAEHAKK